MFKTMPLFEEMMKGNYELFANAPEVMDFFTIIAEDIKKQKQRIGGNFAIAQAVPSKIIRDHIR